MPKQDVLVIGGLVCLYIRPFICDIIDEEE